MKLGGFNRQTEKELGSNRPTDLHISKSTKNDPLVVPVVKVVNNSELIIDQPNGICLLRWKGRIDIETATELLTLGSAAVQLNGYEKLLIDRRDLIEFDCEARIWIDKWIKTKAKAVAKSVDKLAIINSETIFGNFFNNAFNSTIAHAMPHLKMRRFDNGGKAHKWLLGS